MTTRSEAMKNSKDMVNFEDKGSVFDAPIDVVWDYILSDNKYHSNAHHGSLRNMKWKELNEITGTGSCEVVRGGRWSRMKFRNTTIPPLVRVHEELEGPYAGQKMVSLYTPRGNKTGIDVLVFTPKKVERETRETLAKTFREDVPMLRQFYLKKSERQIS
ncbi:MAG: hypothetical protein ACRECH_07935 [Nitrososphaerales archaeon]